MNLSITLKHLPIYSWGRSLINLGILEKNFNLNNLQFNFDNSIDPGPWYKNCCLCFSNVMKRFNESLMRVVWNVAFISCADLKRIVLFYISANNWNININDLILCPWQSYIYMYGTLDMVRGVIPITVRFGKMPVAQKLLTSPPLNNIYSFSLCKGKSHGI